MSRASRLANALKQQQPAVALNGCIMDWAEAD